MTATGSTGSGTGDEPIHDRAGLEPPYGRRYAGTKMNSVQLYNTRTRAKETFVPADPSGNVRLFVCGPTVYELPHLGHAKTYTQFDFIVRFLRARGYAVTYVQNITDVDDKIIRRARELGAEPSAVARRYEQAYLGDMSKLRNDSVDVYARASDYVEEVISQVKRLQEAGAAYATPDGIYFDLNAFPDYGRLSGRLNVRRDDAVSRLDANPDKRNPGDFVLWKARRPGEPFWTSELGDGRPGWHIEDTAITERLLGAQYDLHGGAIDLIFPHHEAEIAQMETISGRRPMAAHWLHTGLLTTGEAKLSKSLGNFVAIRDALATASVRAIRFAFFSSHYRSPMTLTDDTFSRAARALDRLDRFVDGNDPDAGVGEPGPVRDARTAIDAALVAEFLATFALDADASFVAPEIEINKSIEERERLRRSGRFAEADRIRDRLRAQGIVLEDSRAGVRWRRSSRLVTVRRTAASCCSRAS